MAEVARVAPVAPLLVTVEVAAEMLSLSPETVQGLTDEGTLVSVQIAGETRIGVAGLQALVEDLVLLSFSGADSLGEAYGVIEELARGKREALDLPDAESTSEPTVEESLTPKSESAPTTEPFGLGAYL